MPAKSPAAKKKRRVYYLLRSRRIRSETRARLHEIKSTKGCADCGDHRGPVLQFHHLDPTVKEFGIGTTLAARAWSIELAREIEKCIVLCANCHIMRHWQERHEAVPR